MYKRQHFLTPQRYQRFLENYQESRAFLQDNRLQANSDEQEACSAPGIRKAGPLTTC